MKKHLLMAVFASVLANAQAPSGYYNSANGLSGASLKTALSTIITNGHLDKGYNGLWTAYKTTDIDKNYENDGSILDIYSEKPVGTDPYKFTPVTNQCGTYSVEGNCYNREHIIPQSFFNEASPMVSDIHFIRATDGKVNGMRSNYPFGKVGTATFTSKNGSKLGNSVSSGFSGTVFEPIDEFKGDVARMVFYFVTRYQSKLSTFTSGNMLGSSAFPGLQTWELNVLLAWHNQDPVSQAEINRNNASYTYQGNRNPFIDNPSWVNTIWGQTPDAVAPQTPTNVTVTQNSAYFTTLSWTPSASTDVIGYKIYQNGTLVGSTKGTTFTADHLTPSTAYNFTVKAYDNGYLLSSDSNTASATTLASDIYAKDLMVTKYLEGTSNNKGIEITNKTGHPVNLSDYRLSIQFSSGTNYYFVDPYELEGTVQNNETFVVLNPDANFSCYTINQAKFVTAAPQMTYSGSQYLELRYKSSTVDAIGVSGTNNSSVLGNVSLYRKSNVAQPTTTFNISEWDSYASNYCQSLGTLATAEAILAQNNEFKIYPNPVNDHVFVSGKTENIKSAQILDLSGKVIYTEQNPFKNKKGISVQNLSTGTYLLKIDDKIYQFIKK
ncbi:MAG TPA: endonuclease I [Chryseobacterium sp.]|nr:endonuclease I [Chryseobacterium sp.]